MLCETSCLCQETLCIDSGGVYGGGVPKLWNETIEAHRRDVRDAILDTTAVLVFERGLLAVTMSQIAEEVGIGRATLYKYFPDVEAILAAWHHRQITAHLDHLIAARDHAPDPRARLAAVLEAYAHLAHGEHGRHDADLVAVLHHDEQVTLARQQVGDLLRDLLADAARTGDVRADVAPGELAAYCLHAVGAARALRSKAAVRRLVAVILAGLGPPA
jgi:AcrR family transcriptional regulator